jgi:hypothetical protein
MSDQFRTEPSGARMPDISLHHPWLPVWLARRLLRPGENITWVGGPRLSPPWEEYVTHPALFLLAVALGAVCLGIGRSRAGSWSELPLPFVLAAGGIVLASVFVLGFFSGYFTRLVVTDLRLLIVQGREICRSWDIEELPTSLVRYRLLAGGERLRAIDLDAMKTLLGSASDKFIESKTILAFGKELERIKARERGRP